MSSNFTIKSLISKPINVSSSKPKLTAVELVEIKNIISDLHFESIGPFMKATCSKCGGNNMQSCKCAKQAYIKTITVAMIERYNEKKDILSGKELANYIDLGK